MKNKKIYQDPIQSSANIIPDGMISLALHP